MKGSYHHVERSALSVIEALLKGHIVRVGGDLYRYFRKDDFVYTNSSNDDMYCSETGIFQYFAQSDVDGLWLPSGFRIDHIPEFLSKKSNDSEVDSIISNLSFDTVKRKANVSRYIADLKRSLEVGDCMSDTVLNSYLNYPNVLNSVHKELYAKLQSGNKVAIDYVDFVGLLNQDEIFTNVIKDVTECLVNSGKLINKTGIISIA